MSQLTESTLLTEFNTIKTSDFRKTVEADLDDWEIEYKSDFYYQPRNKPPITFLGYTIRSASFYLTRDEKVEKFGLRISLNDAEGFYYKMVSKYGDYSVCSPSKQFFINKGYILPKENSKEAQELIAQMPIPSLTDYKDINTITWYDIAHKNDYNEITIKMYNIPQNSSTFREFEHAVRIVFSIQE